MAISPGRKGFVAEGYPALREFFTAYLHDDFKSEHGSAVGAARAFCESAGTDELSQARGEWKRLESVFTGKTIAEKHAILRQLGAGWMPQRDEDLHSVMGVLERSR